MNGIFHSGGESKWPLIGNIPRFYLFFPFNISYNSDQK